MSTPFCRASILVASAIAVIVPLSAQVTWDRLLHADKEPQNWLTYSGTVGGQRYSPLTQITPANVKNLELQWVWQARSVEKFETTALVVDGILYTVQAPNDVYALDAVTGRIFWTLPYTPAPEARPCCGRVNRGLAILGDTLYMGTFDAHLLAIDATNGKILWNKTVGSAADRYAITHAPLIVKDKVIVGMAGGDGPIRSYIAAFDAKTGKEVWRFYTIPWAGRAGQRNLVRRFLENRRRRGLEHRRLRFRHQPYLLGNRKSCARYQRRHPPRRQPL
jgi:alcohol dehydrogenase (cytochrome c)